MVVLCGRGGVCRRACICGGNTGNGVVAETIHNLSGACCRFVPVNGSFQERR